jgi:hypothetical protein
MDELGDVAGIELPVAVDVDDDVRPAAHGTLEPGAENFSQTRPIVKRNDNCPRLGSALGGLIGRAVVDDDHFDFAHPRNLPRHAGDHLRDGVFFVQGGDRDQKLHKICCHPARRYRETHTSKNRANSGKTARNVAI